MTTETTAEVSATAATGRSARTPGVTRIAPTKGWSALRLGDVWAYHELLFFLVWRDVKVKYKQTVAGAAWAVLQPVIMMLLFVAIFGRVSGIKPQGVPYAVYLYSGLLPWQLFAAALGSSGASLVANQQLVTKVYVPRLVIPIAATLSPVVDFSVGFVVLLGLMAIYGIVPTLGILLVPVLVAYTVVTALAVGLWLSALNVRYRDIQYILPFMVQIWFFLTPILYDPAKVVPERLKLLYALNPMFGVVQGFRWALLGTATDVGPTLALSVCVVAVLLLGGLFYFRRTEKSFADLV